VKKLTARDRFLIIVLACIVMVAFFWFFVRAGLVEQKARLSKELEQKKGRVEEYRTLARQRESLEREYRTIQDRIQAIEAKLPPAREIPQLLRTMQAVATETGVKLVLLRPGPLEIPKAAVTPGQPQPKPTPGQPPQAGDVPYQLFKLDLAFEGSYETMIAFLRRLENFPRFIAITQVNLNVLELPGLRLSVASNTFVLPDTITP
jgi:Tfp pilus assembly protein PilO